MISSYWWCMFGLNNNILMWLWESWDACKYCFPSLYVKQATVPTRDFNTHGNVCIWQLLKIQPVLYIWGYTRLLRSHLWEPESLSMPFRAFFDTMTKWSCAATFIFQLWPGASDTRADRGKWKEAAAANGTVLYLLNDLAYPPAVWALPLNPNNMAAECRANKKRGLHG